MDTQVRHLLKCLRCGWRWLSKKSNPARCAKCRSPYWNRPKEKT